jgi:hypothetical protein
MSGFKTEGTDSPFDDDEEDNEVAEDVQEQSTTEPRESMSETSSTTVESDDTDEYDMPYVLKRRTEEEKTTWRRDRVTFYLRDDVKRGERRLIADSELEFDRDLPKFDVREAAYLAAQNNPGLVYEELEKMGYDRE